MILNTLIVDDEPAAIEGLRIRLQAFPEVRVIGEATSVAEALTLINDLSPDLIFLDIEMPEQSGFDLIRQLQPEQCPAIVFVTAFHQHAVKAFEVRALDYLLKPVKQQRNNHKHSRQQYRNYRAAILCRTAETGDPGRAQSNPVDPLSGHYLD